MTENEAVIEKADIGSALKAAREDKGLTLEEAAATLRIRSDHLRALEEDDFDRLPGSVYAIGFIRTYATHLGLNAAEMITRYKSQTQPLHADEPSYDPQSEPDQVSGMVKSAIVVGGIFSVYLIWLIAGGARGPEPVAEAPAVPAVEQEAAADAVAARVTAPPQRPQAAPQPAAKPSDTQTSAAPAAPAQAEPAAPEVAAAPTQPSNNDTRAVLPEADPLSSDPTVTVAPIASLTATVPAKVEIRAERRTWMRIENTQGRVLFSSIIRADESFELTDDDAYTLATRDAGALQFVVDGEAVGAVGRRGQILTARRIARTDVLGRRP